jgi:hypothetical protein
MTGKGSHYHQEMVKFLENKYGESLPKSYSGMDKRFQADYVFKNAWVDVVYYEGWMESLGEFVVNGNQILNSSQEFWLIFYAKALVNHRIRKNRQYRGMSDQDFINKQREWYSFLKNFARNVLVKEIKGRVRVWDYESEGTFKTGRLVEIK